MSAAGMAFEFRLPDIGEGVVEGEIVKWLIKPGDAIEVDQPMVEVMTDKATVVIPSPRKGRVAEIRGAEGDIAAVGSVIVVIAEPGEASVPTGGSLPSPPAAEAEGARASGPSEGQAHRTGRPGDRPATPPSEAGPPRAAGGRALAAPATRRLARELGLDLELIEGTGPAGRVTSADVRRAAEHEQADRAGGGGRLGAAAVDGRGKGFDGRPSGSDMSELSELSDLSDRAGASGSPGAFATPGRPSEGTAREGAREGTGSFELGEVDEVVPARGVRRKIWEAMTRSAFTAPHFTFVEECDLTALVALRDRLNLLLDADGEPPLTFLPFIVKAVCVALSHHPDLNGQVDDAQKTLVRRADKHIGIAVAADQGLTVPVVRHAHRRSLLGLSREIRRLSEAVRTGAITAADLGGSTFSVTSLGKEGGLFATPILNYPEVGILGVHRLSARPVVRDDDRVVIRRMVNLSLSCDHRWIDGQVAASFIYRVIRLLEDPDRLVLEGC